MSKVSFSTTDLYICKLRQDILNKYTWWFPASLFVYLDASRVSMSNFCAVVQVAAAPYDNIKFFN